jgi:hypothetical protein
LTLLLLKEKEPEDEVKIKEKEPEDEVKKTKKGLNSSLFVLCFHNKIMFPLFS